MKLTRSSPRSPAAIAISLVVGVATVYCWLAYAGPFRWLAEWQLERFGSYHETLTLMGTLVGFYVVATPLFYATRRMTPRPTIADIKAGRDVPPREVPMSAVRRSTAALWIGGLGLGCIVAAAVVGWSGIGSADSASAGVDELVLEAAAQPIPDLASARVTGTAQTSLIATLQTTIAGSTRTRTYVPLTEPGWHPGDPLRVFLATNQDAWLEPGSPPHVHRLEPNAAPFRFTSEPARVGIGRLPGPVRERYRRDGVVLADEFHIVEQGSSVGQASFALGAVLAIVGFALLLGAVLAGIAIRRRPAQE